METKRDSRVGCIMLERVHRMISFSGMCPFCPGHGRAEIGDETHLGPTLGYFLGGRPEVREGVLFFWRFHSFHIGNMSPVGLPLGNVPRRPLMDIRTTSVPKSRRRDGQVLYLYRHTGS